ncbi:MAG: hypothetical protein C5B54_05575 [Acidobacteria bacterium]|nr:MAG: hypothetical protein C5B54_05575 [Acidobacteriota bacterium]
MTAKKLKSLLTEYVSAVAAITLAVAVRWFLDPYLNEQLPLVTLYGAIAFAVWFGGYGPAIVAVILGYLACDYLFIAPRFSFLAYSFGSEIGIMMYFVTCGVIVWLGRSAREAKLQATKQLETLNVTLSSIGDAVIAANHDGLISFMNPVAEKLTGWPLQEAIGKPLENVFQIMNEETRQRVTNPALKAMQDGGIYGLANHTVLIARNGVEIAIDDSGAPIRDHEGKIIGAILVFRDIAERRLADRIAANLAEIVKSSEDAIITKNLDGVITSWNRAAERMFGYTAEEAIGRSITIIIPPERLEEEQTILTRLRQGERVEHFETVRVSKDGNPIDISLTVSPMRDSEGRTIGASKIARNITERKFVEQQSAQLVDRERTALAQAEAANRSKDEFLATVSHELRAPLNAIIGWARLLAGSHLDPNTRKRGIEVIEQSAWAQSRLIEDLLESSQAITGRLSFNFAPIDFAKTIETALDIIAPTAKAKSIELQTYFDGDNTIILADEMRLKQVIWNLVSNAVKFTPPGGKIEIHFKRTNSHAEMIVSDTGQGINPEFFPHLFERYRQQKHDPEKRSSGLGLGLAIVRYCVEMHGGTVEAHSEGEGKGSTFIVRLPVGSLDALNSMSVLEE